MSNTRGIPRPAPHPETSHPGRCQICDRYGITWEYWPAGLPARYADLCADCVALGDMEICRRLDPYRRRDGAVI